MDCIPLDTTMGRPKHTQTIIRSYICFMISFKSVLYILINNMYNLCLSWMHVFVVANKYSKTVILWNIILISNVKLSNLIYFISCCLKMCENLDNFLGFVDYKKCKWTVLIWNSFLHYKCHFGMCGVNVFIYFFQTFEQCVCENIFNILSICGFKITTGGIYQEH